MSNIHTELDIATRLHAEMGCVSDLVVVEHTRQPEEFSPKFGWDFMASQSARQFHVEIGEDWALIILQVVDGDLVFYMPAHSQISDRLPDVVAKIIAAVADATQVRRLRQARDRGDGDPSAEIVDLASGLRAKSDPR